MKFRLAGVLIVGVSLIISAVIFGSYFYQSRAPVKTIRVVGSATRRIDSDIVKWRVSLSRNTGTQDLETGYLRLKSDLENFMGLLKANGIGAENITVQPVNSNQIYSQYEKSAAPVGYNITQGIFVVSKEIAAVEKMALNPGLLTEKGIMLQNSNLEYYSSKLSDYKKELLAKAAIDARKRADVIAQSTGDRISRIDSVRSGVFQITEPYSTEVSDYGIYNTSTRTKDITITVNAVYRLQ